jgi:hypothetical protein
MGKDEEREQQNNEGGFVTPKATLSESLSFASAG